MNLKIHTVVVLAGAIAWAIFSMLMADHVPPQPKWYHVPLIFPIYVAAFFEKGHENLNVVAGNIAWVLECVAIGFALDAMFFLIWRRSRLRRN